MLPLFFKFYGVEEHARSGSRGVDGRAGELRSSSERVGNHKLLVADPPTALKVTAEGASCAARAVPSDSVRLYCPACWLLDVSRLIASRMVFRAQGESPASCARELGLNPAAPLRDAATHIEPKEFL